MSAFNFNKDVHLSNSAVNVGNIAQGSPSRPHTSASTSLTLRKRPLCSGSRPLPISNKKNPALWPDYFIGAGEGARSIFH